MEFADPWWLVLLLALPIVGWLLRRPGDHGSGGMLYPNVWALRKHVTLRMLAARGLPWLTVIALALLIVAMARPRRLDEVVQVSSEGIDIVLALDVSGSMRAEDFQPHNRFMVAQDVLHRFIDGSDGDRLALVVFAGKAFTQCPLTLDYDMVQRLLGQVQIGMIEDGTAIGMAIATAAARLELSDADSRVIILLTDGVNNTGAIDPVTAAKAAGAIGVKIYAVGVGSDEGARIPIDDPVFGRNYARNPDGSFQRSDMDEETLRRVAELSGGEYFRAADPQTLRDIYERIRAMEKSRFETTEYRRYQELAGTLIWPAVVLLALQALLANTWLRKIP
ncbi:MAG: VWA domain-containing protein [candidate division WS1 bacterium]|jgi:Ca-activated chloride channel family protein|nr:VWA domain-containing protein [candidate division WS1 bacterium]